MTSYHCVLSSAVVLPLMFCCFFTLSLPFAAPIVAPAIEQLRYTFGHSIPFPNVFRTCSRSGARLGAANPQANYRKVKKRAEAALHINGLNNKGKPDAKRMCQAFSMGKPPFSLIPGLPCQLCTIFFWIIERAAFLVSFVFAPLFAACECIIR